MLTTIGIVMLIVLLLIAIIFLITLLLSTIFPGFNDYILNKS